MSIVEKLTKIIKRQKKELNEYQAEHEILLDEIDKLKKENNLLKSGNYYVRLFKQLKEEEKLRALVIITNPKNKELATRQSKH